jgi:hypothetical protein
MSLLITARSNNYSVAMGHLNHTKPVHNTGTAYNTVLQATPLAFLGHRQADIPIVLEPTLHEFSSARHFVSDVPVSSACLRASLRKHGSAGMRT